MVLKLHIEGISKFDDIADAAFAGKQLIKSKLREESGLFAKDLQSWSQKRYLSGRPGLKVQTGRLRSSIQGRVQDVEKGLEISLGTDVPYAIYHEQPDGSGSGRMPQRAFLAPALADLFPSFEKRVEAILTRFASGGLKREQ